VKQQTLGKRPRGVRVVIPLLAAAVAALAYLAWAGVRQGAAPAISVDVERPAIGRAARVAARFAEPDRGLGTIRLELEQGGRTVVLGERSFPRAGAFSPLRGAATAEAAIEAGVGVEAQPWLAEGDAVLRATADRMAGFLRSAAPVVVERRVPVRLRPPSLAVTSAQHYLRQGGSGAVLLRVGATAVRSGVRAGERESLSFPRPGGGEGERFVLFAVPPEVGSAAEVAAFAEDDAGNRVEARFVDSLRRVPQRRDRITLSEAFLAAVVPAIEERTPGLDATGELAERYVRINGGLREVNLAEIAGLAHPSVERFLWSGAFLQMPDTQLRAGFAEHREYLWKGAVVDRQTHLGLDLASTARAPVPAANAGVVVFAGWLGIYGQAVAIDHGYGLMSLYGHLSSIATAPGARVEKGQTIAASGATGLAGGDHLHLEIFVQGQSVDPVEWLDEHWIRAVLGSKLPEVAAAAPPRAAR